MRNKIEENYKYNRVPPVEGLDFKIWTNVMRLAHSNLKFFLLKEHIAQ